MLTCENPQIVWNNALQEYITVPCGHCSSCLRSKSLNWVQRIEVERLSHPASLFVTLTFDDAHLPVLSYDDALSLIPDSDIDYFNDCWLRSSKVISFYNGLPYIGARPFQLFIKRLRRYVYKHFSSSLDSEKLSVRYFCCMEYGPTTYRPHYHCILFFNDFSVADTCLERMGSFWSDYNVSTCQFTSIGRYTVEYVKSSANCYVSEYLNCVTDLPQIFSYRLFRPCSYKSTLPPIGLCALSDSQIQRIFSEKALDFSIKESDSGEVKRVPFWRTFEMAFFPKCISFSSLNHQDRVLLYAYSSQVDSGAFYDIAQWLMSEWPYLVSSSLHAYEVWRKVLQLDSNILKYDDFNTLPYSLVCSILSRLTRIVSVSRRVILLSHRFGFSLYQFVSLIEDYYKRKDYRLLAHRLQEEENASQSLLGDSVSQFLRIVPVSSMNFDSDIDYVISRYGLTLDDFIRHDWLKSDYVQSSKRSSDEWFQRSHKKRVRYDYLNNNPRVAKLHGFDTY